MAATALITGAARRVGAEIASELHAAGYNVFLHYRNSKAAACELCDELNADRSGTARVLEADLLHGDAISDLVEQVTGVWDGLDVLINNASSFYPTPVDAVTEAQWDEMMGSNLKAPFFLSKALAPLLRTQKGCIVNIVDIHALRPLKGYPVYSIAKSGLVAMTRSLAREFGPDIRVNGVAPGAILWPDNEISEVGKKEIISRIALARTGNPVDVARAVLFLVRDADYITGQILPVDGGRSLFS